MTHRHFITVILLAAFTITGLQASNGFGNRPNDEPPALAQKEPTQGPLPAG
ncbi:MAG: hypothetical protein AAF965_09100 [Pseudomonadota bacterium]